MSHAAKRVIERFDVPEDEAEVVVRRIVDKILREECILARRNPDKGTLEYIVPIVPGKIGRVVYCPAKRFIVTIMEPSAHPVPPKTQRNHVTGLHTKASKNHHQRGTKGRRSAKRRNQARRIKKRDERDADGEIGDWT